MRIYDSRIRRFLSVDPITANYPELTPYQFASNRTIDGVDQDGLEYSPAGSNNGMARDGTAVRLLPLHPVQMSAIKEINDYIVNGVDVRTILDDVRYGRKEKFPIQRSAPSTVGRASADPSPGTYAANKKAENTKYLNAKNGLNEDGSRPWFSDNEHMKKFEDKLLRPMLNASTFLIGSGEVNILGKGFSALAPEMEATFMGGKSMPWILQNDVTMFRVGQDGKALGQFFSMDAPQGILQVRIDKAILPVWPRGAQSVINTAFKIKIPAGTLIRLGEVAPQGGIYLGGTPQILVEKPWLIKGVEVLDSYH